MTDEDLEQAEKQTRRERRAQAKGGSEPTEVRDRNARLRAEAAATRKRQRAEERAVAVGEGLATSERIDDALVRSADTAGKFVRTNFAWLQWIIVLGAGAGIFALVMRYRTNLDRDKHGHVLASVLGDENGKLVSTEAAEQRDPRLVDTRTEFADETARNKKALDAWGQLKKNQSPEVLVMARLGVANAQFDLKKYAESGASYRALADDPKASSAPGVKARALEGIGLSLEAEGKYADALNAFEQLTKLDEKATKQLGRFHMARSQHLLGKDEEAKKLLTELNAALSKDAPAEGPEDYLGAAVRDLLRTVDPQFAIQERQELEKKQAEEQSKRLQEMIEQMKKKNGDFSFPGLPKGVTPTPIPPSSAPAIPAAPAVPGPSTPQQASPQTTAPTPPPTKSVPSIPAVPSAPQQPIQQAPASTPIPSAPTPPTTAPTLPAMPSSPQQPSPQTPSSGPAE